ncbi:MAG: hypothetical protein JWP04_283 [Belnapia sp.]|jgi:hypothetical protein|nr:hypothetical protein [Belnapia sp.]
MLSFSMADLSSPDPPRQLPAPQPLIQRLQPLVDVLYKLLVASAAALAVWKGLR